MNHQIDTSAAIVLDEEPTNPEYGNYPHQRSIENLLQYGFIPLDKQEGPSSHQVVAWTSKLFNNIKTGHSGTLDPLVTGLLPVGLAESTKALSILLLGPKEYIALAKIHDSIPEEKIKQVFGEFIGNIYQRPPQRSAVKRVTRTREIYSLEIIQQKDRFVLMKISCEAGTYIRKLIYDAGELLGCGASMLELRRTKVAHITESDGLVRLHDLFNAKYLDDHEQNDTQLRKLIQPVESITKNLKYFIIRDSAVDSICHGAQLAIPGILKLSNGIIPGDNIAIYSQKEELIAIAESVMNSDQIQISNSGIACKTKRVIMKNNTYPKMWKSDKNSRNDAGVV